MKIRFKLMTEKKADQNGCFKIAMFVLWKNNRVVFYTEEKSTKKQWDEKSERARRSHPQSQALNDTLDILSEKVTKEFRRYSNDSLTPSPEQIKSAISNKEIVQEKTTILDVFSQFIDSRAKSGNKDTSLKHYRKMYNHLKAWADTTKGMNVEDLTEAKFYEFIEYMKSKRDYHPNTVGNWIKYYKTFFHWCNDSGIKTHGDTFKIKKLYVEPEKIFLTQDELEKLINATDLPPKLEKVRDVFVFTCMTGLRYSDFSKVSKEQIKEVDGQKYISFIPVKTNSQNARSVKRVEIPLVPIVLQIIEKYEGKTASVIPVISNQKMNDYLKELGKLCGIDTKIEKTIYKENQPDTVFIDKYELITCHVARHTFATLALMKGIPLPVVSKLLGHTDLKTTMIYAKVTDQHKASELNKAFGGFLMNT